MLRKSPKRFLEGLEDRAGAALGETGGGFKVSNDAYFSYAEGCEAEPGIIPSKDKKATPGEVALSSRMIKSLLPGAGLLGAVESGLVCRDSASRWMWRKWHQVFCS